MDGRPRDTSPEAWRQQLQAFARLGAAGRLEAALRLSDEVREIQLAGLMARHAGWTRADAVRHIVTRQYGLTLPRTE